MAARLRIFPLNENALLLDFSEEASVAPNPELAYLMGQCREFLLQRFPTRIVDCVASYTGVVIYFDILQTAKRASLAKALADEILQVLPEFLDSNTQHSQKHTTIIEIPVYYGGEAGPDLERLAQARNISCEEFIALHAKPLYSVYALGFQPGFAYLGFVDEQISAPRLKTPRAKVPAGSVGIADRQTAVYPNDSPGGWNIIGRTPKSVFANKTSIFSIGTRVRFIALADAEKSEAGDA